MPRQRMDGSPAARAAFRAAVKQADDAWDTELLAIPDDTPSPQKGMA